MGGHEEQRREDRRVTAEMIPAVPTRRSLVLDLAFLVPGPGFLTPRACY